MSRVRRSGGLRPRSLRAQFFVALALVSLVPLGLLGLGGALLQRQVIAGQSARELTGLARGLAGELDTYFDGLLGDARLIAGLPDVVSQDPVRQASTLRGVFLTKPATSRLSVFDLAGNRLATVPDSTQPTRTANAALHAAAAQGEQVWTLRTTVAGRPALSVVTPIRDADRRVVGLLGALFDLGNLTEVVARVPIGGGGAAFVLGTDGQVLLTTAPGDDQGNARGGRNFGRLVASPGGGPAEPGMARYSAGGEMRTAGYAPVTSLGWTVVVELPEAEVLAPADRFWQLALFGLLLGATLTLLGASLLARRLAGRFRALAAAAAALGAGDSTAPLPRTEPGEGELGTLIEAFERMRQAVETREADLRLLADVSSRLASSLDYDATLREVARAVLPTLADWCFVDLLDEAGGIRRVEVAVADPARAELAEQLKRFAPDPHGGLGIGRVIETGESELTPDYPDAELVRVTRDAEHLRLTRAIGLRSCIRVPLTVSGRMLGVLTFLTAESGRRLERADLLVAEEIGHRAALAIDHARAYREAREAIRARDEFLSIASHELRTPVTVIRGAAQASQRARARGALDPARLGRALSIIDEATGRLARLIDDLLDVSRLRTGRLPLEWHLVDLTALVSALAERYRDQLDRGHRLTVRLPSAPCRVMGDAGRLDQVLTNLIENALKYSPDGGEIAIALKAGPDGALVTVDDPGIGLPPGMAERIFHPFGRAPNAAERQIPGLGLGLHICRNIVERHGGRIWAESAGEGQGTRLSLWLPPPEPADGLDRPAGDRERGGRGLVAG